jgi:hypothetical protein
MQRQSSGQRNTVADINLNIYKRDDIHQFVNSWITNEPHFPHVSIAILLQLTPRYAGHNSKSNHTNPYL